MVGPVASSFPGGLFLESGPAAGKLDVGEVFRVGASHHFGENEVKGRRAEHRQTLEAAVELGRANPASPVSE